MTGIELGKEQLRKRLLMRRAIQSVEDLSDHAARATGFLYRSSEWKRASTLFVFVSMAEEFPTYGIIERAWHEGKTVAVPKVLGKRQMAFRPIEKWDDLRPGIWGIREPTCNIDIKPRNLDLLLAPGLAFDREGNRLGYGGGFYDSYLGGLMEKPVAIGLCLSWQVLDYVPHDENDFPLAGLCNENGLLWSHD